MAEETATETVEIIHPSQGIISEAPKPEETEQEATASPEPEAKAEEPKEKAKPPVEGEPPKDETSSPKPTWEEEKKVLEKRLRDTQDWGNRQSQENAALKRGHQQLTEAIEILNKKIDGTWTDEDESARQARAMQEEQVYQHHQSQAMILEGKLKASREAANIMFGKEVVDQLVFADNSPFMYLLQDPVIRDIITQSDSPVQKGIELMRMQGFEDKYGNTPEAIYANIEKEVEAKLRAKVEKEYKESLGKKAEIPKGIGDIPNTDKPMSDTAWGLEQQMDYMSRTRAGSRAS